MSLDGGGGGSAFADFDRYAAGEISADEISYGDANGGQETEQGLVRGSIGPGGGGDIDGSGDGTGGNADQGNEVAKISFYGDPNNFVIPATVLEKFRVQRVSL